jgi:beta-glucosidase
LQGIKDAFPNSKISFAKGCDVIDNSDTGFAEALKKAEASDVIIMVMGGSNPSTGGEQKDRMDLRLMGQQQNLIKEMVKLKKPLVVVLVNGGPVIVKDWINEVDGVLMAWYSGEEGGKAIGEILSGKCNPSGKLPTTFPLDNGQIPIYYGSRPYGRDGIVIEIPKPQQMDRYFPQFPFGYGLSYTKFDYTNIRCSNALVENGKSVDILVDIQNTGSVDGDEIVQLYLTDSYCRITRPVKELINFKRISLKIGEKKTLKFTVTPKDMSFLNEDLKPEVEPGEFVIMAGKNAVEGISTKFNIK